MNELLPPQRGSGLFHTGDYFVYEASWVNGKIRVTPAYGYPNQWGESPDDEWFYEPEKFMQNFYPGDSAA